MTNQGSYQFNPSRYGSMRSDVDLFSSRDISFGREQPTPNQFFGEWVRGQEGRVFQWTLALNSFDGGLGRVRGSFNSLTNRTRGEIEGAPLDTRYVDSLHLPTIRRTSTTPALTSSVPADPSFRAVSSNSGTGTTATGNAPPGMAEGDVLEAWIMHDDASTSISAVPSGWSQVQKSSPGSTGDFVVTSYEKIATAADVSAGDWEWTLDNSERWRAIVVAVEGGAPSGVAASAEQYGGATASRFYMPTTGSAPISPDFSSGWDAHTAAAGRRLGAFAIKQGTTMETRQFKDSNTTDRDNMFRQYVYQPALTAQTISAQTVKIQIRGAERRATDDMHLAWTVKVVSSDGNTVRGTVVALRRDGNELQSFLMVNRGDSTTSTQVIAQAGDYLVLEVGTGGKSASSADHHTFLRFGDSAEADLPEDDTETDDLSPWIEFANPLSFEGGGEEGEISALVERDGSLVLSLGAVDANSVSFTGATDSGGSLTERLDSSANSISTALYSETVSTVGEVMHTIDQSGTTDLVTQMVVIPPSAFGKRISHVNLFGRHAIAVGDSDLIRESNELTPQLQTIGYSPGSVVNGLAPLIIGGNDAVQRVAVLRSDGPIELLNDLSSTPASAGTMHADTEPAFGLIQTSLLESDILIYANNAISVLSRTDAIATQPTVTLSNVPNGGGALGELWIPGAPLRAYWLFPVEDTGADQAEIHDVPMKVVSTNLFGDDKQDLNIPLWAAKGAGHFVTAAIWQEGLVATDGHKVIWFNGRSNILNWPGERPRVGSAGHLVCRGFWVKGQQLVILVQRLASHHGSGASLYWLEEYDERTDAFHQISAVTEFAGGVVSGAYAVGSYPVSVRSDIMYWHDDTNWTAQYLTDLLRNPAIELNGIEGAGQHVGFESQASWTSPDWILPGFGKVPSVVSEVQFIGEPEDGGEDGSVTVEIAHQDRSSLSFDGSVQRTFYAGDRWDAHHAAFPRNTAAFDRLQVRITGARGAEINRTPQCLPVIIRGLAFVDGQVRDPASVLGADWLARF